MISDITNPIARAEVSWLPPEAGGRRSGPPTATVYAATCAFALGDDADVLPGWPAAAAEWSILLQQESGSDGPRLYKVDFLYPDRVRNFVRNGAELVILEGHRVVATAVLRDVMDFPARR